MSEGVRGWDNRGKRLVLGVNVVKPLTSGISSSRDDKILVIIGLEFSRSCCVKL